MPLAAPNLDDGLPTATERASSVGDDNRLNLGLASDQSGVNDPRALLVFLGLGEGAFDFAF